MVTYYEDLTPYDCYGKKEENTLNVGWLDGVHPFSTGDIKPELLTKLLLLTCETTDEIKFIKKRKQKKRRPKNRFNIENTEPLGHICITYMLYRGFDLCPFDNVEVNLKAPDSDRTHLVGMREMRIPNSDGTVLYSFPDMLAHYIQEHNYLPPKEFLESLEKFPLNKLFYV